MNRPTVITRCTCVIKLQKKIYLSLYYLVTWGSNYTVEYCYKQET